jgi:ATP-dependent Clp protease ATP-binding subunit ClpC
MAQDRGQDRGQQLLEEFGVPYTPATAGLVNSAAEEAARLRHNYIGTEHLLLGATAIPECQPYMEALKLDPKKMRSAVEFIIGTGDRLVTVDNIVLTPRSKKVIELGIGEQQILGDRELEPDHVILGIAKEGGGIGIGVIESLGVSKEMLHSRVLLQRQVTTEEVSLKLPERSKSHPLKGLPTAIAIGIGIGLAGLAARSIDRRVRG